MRSLYCCSDGVRGRGAPMTYLSHTASFQFNERIAPSNRGIKHLVTLLSERLETSRPFSLRGGSCVVYAKHYATNDRCAHMTWRLVSALVISFAILGCKAKTDSNNFRPTNGLGTVWVAFTLAWLGLLFPDIAGKWAKIDDRSVTRLISAAILFASAVVLADYYYDLKLVDVIRSSGLE